MSEMEKKEITTKLNNFSDIHQFIMEVMDENRMKGRERTETLLVFEALYNDMIERGISGDTTISVREEKSFGDLSIKLVFEGAMYIPMETQTGSRTEGAVMGAYGEKLDYSYHGGLNLISISVKKRARKDRVYSVAALALALLVYFLMRASMSRTAQLSALNGIVFSIEKIFTNAVLMVGAPVTFFSLLRNLTDAYILAERDSGTRELQLRTLITSVISVILAVGAGVLLGFTTGDRDGLWTPGLPDIDTLSEQIIDNLVPSSIFTPFETMSPVPLIMLALLTTYAFCHAGKYFKGIRQVTDACYTLFARMLSVIMFTIPFFFFVAMLDVLLDGGTPLLVNIAILIAAAVISTALLAVFYIVRLKMNGIAVRPFVKKLIPLLKENRAINSAIEAAPFNIRYCTVNYGMDRKKLEKSIPMLAQLNLDGNCFMIMLISLLFIIVTNVSVSWVDILVIMVLVVFLSMGAPNQPGSILIGMLIIINFLEAYEMIAVAIYSEVFLGSVLNIINVSGDIVTVAIDDARAKQRERTLSNAGEAQ